MDEKAALWAPLTSFLQMHPSYLTVFREAVDTMFYGDGPLPFHCRHYLAIMAACRHKCQFLINVHKEEFLRHMGPESWLDGLSHASQKIRDLDLTNRLLAHRPWLLQLSHLKKLSSSPNNWSLCEMVQGALILSHTHALCSFINGCDIKIDNHCAAKRVLSPSNHHVILPDYTTTTSPVFQSSKSPKSFGRTASLNIVTNNSNNAENLANADIITTTTTTSNITTAAIPITPSNNNNYYNKCRCSISSSTNNNNNNKSGAANNNNNFSSQVLTKHFFNNPNNSNSNSSKGHVNSCCLYNNNNSRTTNENAAVRVGVACSSDPTSNYCFKIINSITNSRPNVKLGSKKSMGKSNSNSLIKCKSFAGDESSKMVCSAGQDDNVEKLVACLQVLNEARVAQRSQEDKLKLFIDINRQNCDISPTFDWAKDFDDFYGDRTGSSIVANNPYSLYTEDLEFTYSEFFRKSDGLATPTFTIHDYSWGDQGYSVVSELYSQISNVIDDKFKLIQDLTYHNMGDHKNVDTSKYRTAVWNYIQSLFGIRHDDYDYSEINKLLSRSMKTYIKTLCCYPERMTNQLRDSVMIEFLLSEKVHVNLMIFEARFQAEILYLLRTILRLLT